MKIHTVRAGDRSVEMQKRKTTRVDRQEMKIHTVRAGGRSVVCQRSAQNEKSMPFERTKGGKMQFCTKPRGTG